MADKLARFTPHARRALSLAQDVAVRLYHDEIHAEHLLIGLAREERGTAARVLRALDVEPNRIAWVSRRVISLQKTVVREKRVLTPRAEQVLHWAVDEARRMGHPAIGTEHLLLGLVHESEGMAAQLLRMSGLDLAQVRTEIEKVWIAKRPGHDSAV